MTQLRTAAQALSFVERHGAVLVSARGPLPNLAEAIAGEPIRGSWWGHPQGRLIFVLCEALAEHEDVLSFKLVGGKLTFVHRRLWPVLVKLEARFQRAQLARVWSEHTPSGAHRARSEPFPEWVPPEVKKQARSMSIGEAEELLAPLLGAISSRAGSGRPRRAAPRRRAGRRRSRTGSS